MIEDNQINNDSGKPKKNIENKDQEYYNQEAKKYILLSSKNLEYEEIIKNSPQQLFDFIDEEKINNWEKSLIQINASNKSKIPKDSDINAVTKDSSYPQIQKDVNRTGVRGSHLVENYGVNLENLLLYYTKTKSILYKQGLNEIFGLILFLQYKVKKIKLSTIYVLVQSFIDRFLPNYFYEKELYSLNSSLGLLMLLLKYHEPSVFNRFDSNNIIPEMYAINWMQTYLLGKYTLDISFQIWDYIIKENDPLFMHFFFVAMIICKRELIINCNQNNLLPLLSSLVVVTKEELNEIINKAIEIRGKTPYSFRILANKLGFLVTNNKNVKANFEEYKPLSLPAMPIFPLEALYISKSSLVPCPDEYCKTMQNIRTGDLDFEIIDTDNTINNFGDYICEKCNLKIEKKLRFIMIDLRILNYGSGAEEDESDKTGYLPLMTNVDQDELKSEEIDKIIANRYINERGVMHFLFLTSSTDAFLSFEEKFYKENISEQEKKKLFFGKEEKKTEKELNFDSEKLTKKQIFKLKEYDNLRKILKILKEQNYPYVSFVYGGFEDVHKKSFEFKVELYFHNEKLCLLCQQKNKKEKEKRNKNEEKEKNKKRKLNIKISMILLSVKI